MSGLSSKRKRREVGQIGLLSGKEGNVTCLVILHARARGLPCRDDLRYGLTSAHLFCFLSERSDTGAKILSRSSPLLSLEHYRQCIDIHLFQIHLYYLLPIQADGF